MDILTKLPETETTAAATTAGRSYQPPPAMDSEKVDELEEIIGYKFNDRNLIEQAMTHPSFVRGNRNSSYDRLEYLGDSIISVLFTKLHYFEYSNFSSGHLTPLRASNIDSEKLARVAIKHHLHTYLRHNKPLLEDQIKKFSSDILEYPLHSTGLIEVPKVLADIVESTIGAVFVDSNCCFETVWTVFKDILEPIIDAKTLKRHPMTELCEICQKNSLKVKMVDSWAQNSSIHVYVGDKLLGTGTYLLKKEVAQNRAAKSALNNLGRLTPLRASNIDTEKLARAAVRHGLHTYLRHDKPLLQDQIKKFNSEILDYPLHSTGLIEVPKILADIVESTIGAIFVDSNCCFETVWMVLKTLLQPFISIETLKRHPVTELYEMCQKNHLKLKFVDLWVETYTINVYIDDQLVGTASYAPKKEIAQNRAAKCALQNIDTLIDIKSSQI
ncbi:ribonuclease 3-like protein 3 isoform X2 [Cannabis sativa]|uniref:ribonuclease 3-like protein 3 isoform X2 n=1 Tax=Cannabis sativa TaxID=3483 RepID=UPI0029CAA925|nr:ribonuclease 3-like protein 3 isoform X2 [Cannabis sativa]